MPDDWWGALAYVLVTGATVAINAFLHWLGWMPAPKASEALGKAGLALMRLDRKDREEYAARTQGAAERKIEDRNA